MRKTMTLMREDTKSNVIIPFQIEEEYDYLYIEFCYTPDKCDDRNIFEKGVNDARKRHFKGNENDQQQVDWEKYFPLKNLLTISLDVNGEYIGNAHRWDSNQCIRISREFSTEGFNSPSRIKGKWNAMIHIHGINTPQCVVELSIEGKYND